MKRLGVILFILTMAALASCSQTQSLTVKDYVNWVQREGEELNAAKRVDNISFYLRYNPPAYMTLLSLGEPEQTTKAQFDSAFKSFNDCYYFTFRMKNENSDNELLKENLTSDVDYQNRVSYYAFQAKEDFSLVVDSDTLPCRLCHFERTYNQSPFMTFTLSFEKRKPIEKLSKPIRFTFFERVFGSGPIHLTLDPNDLLQIPTPIFAK